MSEFTAITDLAREIQEIPPEVITVANAAFAELQEKHPRIARRPGYLRTRYIAVRVRREVELTDEQCDRIIDLFERLMGQFMGV
jgi:hypothetical protein